MRTLLVLLPVLLGADGGVAGGGRPAAYGEARRAFVRALDAGALDEARAALARRRAAAPGRIDVGYDLACVEARAGRIDRAFAELEPIAAAGLAVDPAADTDLTPLRGDRRWAPLLARFAAAREAVSPRASTVEVPSAVGLVEDVAEDPRTGALYVTSVRTGEVWRRTGGDWRRWARPAPAGSGAFALGIDTARGVLHVTVGVVPQTEGYRKADEGRSALVRYRLDDGAEVARLAPPGEGGHLLGDMTVTPEGTVLVSDALGGTILRLLPGAGALERLVPPHAFASPQTPALSADGKSVLVPDWTLGLFVVPLAGGTPEPVAAPGDLVTAGIDGLAAAPDGLLAVQNGIVTPRLVRLWLSPDGHRITRWMVLARGPTLADPTHVVRARSGALAIATSGWARFTDEGTPRAGAPPATLGLIGLDLY
jgi:sugar lactone lactonase YvrE